MKFATVAASALLALASSAVALKGGNRNNRDGERNNRAKKGYKDNDMAEPAPTMDIYTSLLSPAVEVPFCEAANPALGNALLAYDGDWLCVQLTYDGLSGPELFSHIHGPAPIGETGPVLFSLSMGQIKRDCFQLSEEEEAFLEAGLLYFNVHSDSCQPGEIRGQILPASHYDM